MITDIGELITRSSDIRLGRPRVAGTGVTVRRIVAWYQLGLNAEEIAQRIGHLSLAQVYAALAYYHLNRDEIETDLEPVMNRSLVGVGLWHGDHTQTLPERCE